MPPSRTAAPTRRPTPSSRPTSSKPTPPRPKPPVVGPGNWPRYRPRASLGCARTAAARRPSSTSSTPGSRRSWSTGSTTTAVDSVYAVLRPGQSYRQQTYVGHPWVVTDERGRGLVCFEPDRRTLRAVIR
ncbi:hypothetical protein V2I01_16320 [Micromonospora sp. BRA006-A]|nr:hypothetical protein [Micromonospora sp. BRA006-A]